MQVDSDPVLSETVFKHCKVSTLTYLSTVVDTYVSININNKNVSKNN